MTWRNQTASQDLKGKTVANDDNGCDGEDNDDYELILWNSSQKKQ